MTKFGALTLAAALMCGMGAVSAQQAPVYYGGCMMGPYYYQVPQTQLAPAQAKTVLLGNLNLNAKQQAAWQNYDNALTASAKAQVPTINPAAPADQRLKEQVANLKARLAASEALNQARQEFVGCLTPEQVQTFNTLEPYFCCY